MSEMSPCGGVCDVVGIKDLQDIKVEPKKNKLDDRYGNIGCGVSSSGSEKVFIHCCRALKSRGS